MAVTKVLFVCLGNICRSPAAEGAFHALVQKKGLEEQFFIDSCGTSGYHAGELPHPNTRKAARKDGIELTHRSRQFERADFDSFDYIIAMDSSNLSDILQMAGTESDKQKILKFRRFDPAIEGEPDVPDPYYGGVEGFANVQKIARRTAEGLLEWILSKQK